MLKRIIFLSLLTVGMVLAYQSVASAGGPWSDQYCNAQIETVIIKNTKGEIVDKKTVETILCDDGRRYASKIFNKEFLKSKNLPIPNWL